MKIIDKNKIKKLFGVHPAEQFCVQEVKKSLKLKYGPYIYKEKYNSSDLIRSLEKCGVKKGDTILIQSSWAEFYNCTETHKEIIDAIIEYLGNEGTLCMACMPLVLPNRVFNVKKSPSKAGLLSDMFRRYPDVIRSRSVQHSVCGVGPNANYLLNEHHLGNNPWDEYSPYYRLSQVNGKIVTLGLDKYWVGTIIHCVEGLLYGKVKYYTDFFSTEKKEFQYIDYDGIQKSYYNYEVCKKRIQNYIKSQIIFRKYLTPHYCKLSNLEITVYDADQVITKLTQLATKGKDVYESPSKNGYKFK